MNKLWNYICLDWVLSHLTLFSWAGVVWNHIGIVPLFLFLLYLLSSYNQTWHDCTLGKNFSKATKSLLTSSLRGMSDIIKLFLVSFQVKIRVSLSFVQLSWNLAHGVNSEALISNRSKKIWYELRFEGEKCLFLRKTDIFAQALLEKSVSMATP